MIKALWFLRRAEHLTRDQFQDWWLNHHAVDVAARQAPHLKCYKINIVIPDQTLPGQPAEAIDWDGVAEQSFEDEAGFRAVYGAGASQPSPTRGDTLAHTHGFARLIVQEHKIPLLG